MYLFIESEVTVWPYPQVQHKPLLLRCHGNSHWWQTSCSGIPVGNSHYHGNPDVHSGKQYLGQSRNVAGLYRSHCMDTQILRFRTHIHACMSKGDGNFTFILTEATLSGHIKLNARESTVPNTFPTIWLQQNNNKSQIGCSSVSSQFTPMIFTIVLTCSLSLEITLPQSKLSAYDAGITVSPVCVTYCPPLAI